MSRFYLAVLSVLALMLLGCSSESEREPAIAEAYAGPATLKLRREIDPRSAEAASVQHGDRLQIVRRRRRFVKVRTASGVEGWTDTRQLLSADQMGALNKLAEWARKLPSQGAATVYEPLNVHTEPNRQAPSFHRIKEGERVDVVAHELSPRVPFEPKAVISAPQAKARPARKPREESSRSTQPPKPPAPGLPGNWLELSKTTLPPQLETPAETEPPKPVPLDDWSLVRLRTGRAGWVLTGMLRMDIPDEVAQYSEGDRITSYFSMAEVNDNGQVKHNWLWTTISTTTQPYEFDSFRYFIWNLRRHRYETAYIEKGLKGYYPVEVHPVQVTEGGKQVTYPGFSLVVEGRDGVKYRKSYAYQTYRVRLVEQAKWEPPGASARPPNVGPPSFGPAPAEKPSLPARLRQSLAAIKHRLFGK